MPANQSDNVFDRYVGQDARVRRYVPMVATDGPLSPGDIAKLCAALDAYMAERKLSDKDVARAIGSTATYVNNLRNQSAALPAATRDKLWRDVRNWMETEARAAERERPEDFVPTSVARKITNICARLATRSDMAVAYGPAGIGKSKTAEKLIADMPDAVLVRVNRLNRTPARLLASVARALTRRRNVGALRYEAVVDRLRKPDSVKARAILIIDEAHKLKPEAMELVRDIFDDSKCSVLLLGTVDVKRMVASDSDPEYGQMASRVGLRVNLAPELRPGYKGGKPLIHVDEIRAMFEREKVRLHPAAARWLAQLANEPGMGAFRRIDRLIDYALLARGRGNDPITVQHLQTAQALVNEDDLAAPPAEESELRQAATA